MIAVDTNVLLHRVLNDDTKQSPKAREVFGRAQRVLITDIVLAEAIWTLKGKRYDASRTDIAIFVDSLLNEPRAEFESREAVQAALGDYIGTQAASNVVRMNTVEFVDALIASKAKFVIRYWGEAYEGTYTFDRAALSIEGMLPV